MLRIEAGDSPYLGVFTAAFEAQSEQFRIASGVNPAFVHMHVDWTRLMDDGTRELVDFQTYHPDARGTVEDLVVQHAWNDQIVALSWDPFSIDETRPEIYHGETEPEITTTQILSGEFDEYIRQVAGQVRDMDTPVMMALFGEADAASLFAYGPDANAYRGTQADETGHYGDPDRLDGPERISDVYRHVIDIFRAEGAQNVSWMLYFSMNVLQAETSIHPADIYPGDEYIDWVGQSVYIDTPDQLDESLDLGYAAWSEISDNPFIIPELGINDTSNPNALAETLAGLQAYENVAAVMLTDFEAATTVYGLPRLGERLGDWEAIRTGSGFVHEVQISDGGAAPQLFGDWRVSTGRDADDFVFRGTEDGDFIVGSLHPDQLIGGNGDDFYMVNNTTDAIVETADGGYDMVLSTASHTLSANVEALILEGDAHLTGTGNAGDNILSGNSGNNRLLGLAGEDTLQGGEGRDTLEGGAGDDVYILDSAADRVIETASGGNDIIVASVDVTMALHVETLVLNGAGDISGTGNRQDNALLGNEGANGLFGAAGDDLLLGDNGNDTLDGGVGNDILIGGNGDASENDQDVLRGGDGDDLLVFGGGDTATGGAGADEFIFEAGPGLSVVTDFTIGMDVLDFSVFGLTSVADLAVQASESDGSLFIALEDGSHVLLHGLEFDTLSEQDITF